MRFWAMNRSRGFAQSNAEEVVSHIVRAGNVNRS
jgi:hypothetical protein